MCDDVRPVTLFDPPSEFLGCAKSGVLEYKYIDAVKMTGHSCPTVAGAYLMTAKVLAARYPFRLPERGAVRVAFASPLDEGVTGVIAAVVTLLTGAPQTNGFKGIGDR